MTPQDVTIFQVLAGLFTLTFIVLVGFLLLFMHRMQSGRARVQARSGPEKALFVITGPWAEKGALRLSRKNPSFSSRGNMLYTVAVVLVILWLLGYVTAYTMGGFIHALLVVAVIIVLVRVIQGRRVL